LDFTCNDLLSLFIEILQLLWLLKCGMRLLFLLLFHLLPPLVGKKAVLQPQLAGSKRFLHYYFSSTGENPCN
jgi:hypothetical protein